LLIASGVVTTDLFFGNLLLERCTFHSNVLPFGGLFKVEGGEANIKVLSNKVSIFFHSPSLSCIFISAYPFNLSLIPPPAPTTSLLSLPSLSCPSLLFSCFSLSFSLSLPLSLIVN